MSLIANLKIGTRLGAFAAALLLLLTVIGMAGLLGLRQVSAGGASFIKTDFVAARALGELMHPKGALRSKPNP